VTAVDASAEEVLAYIWDYCSNELINTTKNQEKNPRELVETIAPNHNIFSTIKEVPGPFFNRRFVFENTWTKRSDGTFIYAWRPSETRSRDDNQLINTGKNSQKKLIEADRRGIVIINRLDESSCDSRKVVYVQQVDIKGNIPARVLERQLPQSLKFVFRVREKFNRDYEIDNYERAKLVAIMRESDKEFYDQQELAQIQKVKLKMLEATKGQLERLGERLGTIVDD